MSEGWDDRTREMGRDEAERAGRGRPRRTPAVNAARLWSGGVATAVVAALLALVGVLIVRVLLQIPYLSPIKSGALGDDNTIYLCVLAALAALAATGLAHLLLVSTPSPMAYFGWIAGLCTAIAAVAPLLSTEPLTVRIATGVIHLVIGCSIISLVTTTASSASTRA